LQGDGACPWVMVTNALHVWVEGVIDKEVLRERLAWALDYYMSNLIASIDWVQDVTEGPLVEETSGGGSGGDGSGSGGADVDAVEGMELEQSSSKAGAYIGAAAGTLAFLLLLALLVRRNRSQDDLSHLKLDEDDDDTFDQDGASDISPNPEYLGRDAHVVGEADSIYSHWTGYTGRRPGEVTGDYNGGTTDVHHCSSATCEICEERRQMGVNFVSARSALSKPPSLPSDASREYILEDTVEL
jgi:hypothetical protein